MIRAVGATSGSSGGSSNQDIDYECWNPCAGENQWNPCGCGPAPMRGVMHIEDEEKAFQALINVRELVLADTYGVVDVALVSGREGEVGAVYEGVLRPADGQTQTRVYRYALMQAEYEKEKKVVEIKLDFGGDYGHTYDETLTFEISSGQIAFTRAMEMDPRWRTPLIGRFFGVLLLPLQLVVLIVCFPCVKDDACGKPTHMGGVYKYIRGYNGPSQSYNVVATSEGTHSQIGEIKELHKMLESGALTQQEYDTMKAKLISDM